MDWALNPNGWHISGDKKEYNITEIEKDETSLELFKDRTFFKECWIKENGLEQKTNCNLLFKIQKLPTTNS